MKASSSPFAAGSLLDLAPTMTGTDSLVGEFLDAVRLSATASTSCLVDARHHHGDEALRPSRSRWSLNLLDSQPTPTPLTTPPPSRARRPVPWLPRIPLFSRSSPAQTTTSTLVSSDSDSSFGGGWSSLDGPFFPSAVFTERFVSGAGSFSVTVSPAPSSTTLSPGQELTLTIRPARVEDVKRVKSLVVGLVGTDMQTEHEFLRTEKEVARVASRSVRDAEGRGQGWKVVVEVPGVTTCGCRPGPTPIPSSSKSRIRYHLRVDMQRSRRRPASDTVVVPLDIARRIQDVVSSTVPIFVPSPSRFTVSTRTRSFHFRPSLEYWVDFVSSTESTVHYVLRYASLSVTFIPPILHEPLGLCATVAVAPPPSADPVERQDHVRVSEGVEDGSTFVVRGRIHVRLSTIPSPPSEEGGVRLTGGRRALAQKKAEGDRVGTGFVLVVRLRAWRGSAPTYLTADLGSLVTTCPASRS